MELSNKNSSSIQIIFANNGFIVMLPESDNIFKDPEQIKKMFGDMMVKAQQMSEQDPLLTKLQHESREEDPDPAITPSRSVFVFKNFTEVVEFLSKLSL